MNKDKMRPKDVKSFSFKYENKSDGTSKDIFLGYDRLDNLVGLRTEQDLENFAYDMIHHVGIKNWKKETEVKGSTEKWEIYLGGSDRTGVTFSGKGPYPAKEFEDGVDRWNVFMQLIDTIETKQREQQEEEREKN